MFDFFHCESNIGIAAAVGGATAVISILSVFLAFKVFKKNQPGVVLSTACCAVCAIIATLFCYHPIVLAGYVISVVCLTVSMTSLCTLTHRGTIYNISPVHMFAKLIIPISVFFEMFRPFFIDCTDKAEIPFYSVWSMFGLKCYNEVQGKYAVKVAARGINPYNVNFEAINITSVITLILFVIVLAMQVVLVWRQFADPDNARDWADIGIVVTCVGVIFIYGMFTSNNFKVTPYSVEHTALAVPMLVFLGILNRLLYFQKFEDFLDKISEKLFKSAT